MVKITDLDGVGPARSEKLFEAGYTDVATIAEADHEELAEDLEMVSEDTALGFVVQAENLVEEEAAEVEEDEPVTQEIDEAVEQEGTSDDGSEADSPSVSENEEDDGPEVYSFTLEPETALQYDVLFASVMRGKETMLQANRTNTEVFDQLLDDMRSADVGDSIEIEADEDGLNTLHNHVRKLAVDYQGNNLIDYMNAMKDVQARVNEVRKDRLF